MSDRLIRWIYNLLFPAAFLALLPGFLRRMVRRGNYQRHFGQRLGWYSREILARLAQGPPRPWVQAVSVGEMLIALKLVAALRRRSPGLRMVLSTTTTTGYQLALERAGEGVEVIYTPIDLLPMVRRAFDVLRPSQIIIVEGGLWPNMLWESERRGVPTALVSARLSPRSERRFRRFLPLAAPMFRRLGLVCAPEPDDVRRWQTLGVPAERIAQTGNIKFDDPAEPLETQAARSAGLRQALRALGIDAAHVPILLAGSTHPGEEAMLTRCFLTLRERFPDLFLILAPRHMERAAQVRSEVEALGLRVALRTATRSATPAVDDPGVTALRPDALLLDTTGELRDWYTLATVVFIGKSMVEPGGGQNPAEAIAVGKAVVFGPHMDNFRDLTEKLLAADAAIQVHDTQELTHQSAWLLADAPTRSDYAARGQRMLESHRGATDRTADLLMQGSGFFRLPAG